MVSVHKRFYVLVWKSFILRKKNWFQTTFEFLCPVIIILASYGLNRISMEGGISEEGNLFKGGGAYIVKPLQNISEIDKASVALKYVAYNPGNAFTNNVMRNLKNSGILPTVELVEQLENEKALKEWLKNKTLSDEHNESIGITFRDTNVKTSTFKYEIRSNSHKMLTEKTRDILTSPYEIYQSHSSFLVVQTVIESEMLKSIGLKFEERQILFGELPKKKPTYAYAVYFLYLFTMIAYVFLIVSVTKEVLEEKATGIRELMKILGVSSWMIWSHWLIYIFIVQLPVSICVTLLLTVIEPIVIQANAFIIWLLFFLFTLNCVFLFFAVSCLFKKPIRGTTACVIGWFVLNISTFMFINNPGDYELDKQILMCLIPLHNLCWALNTIRSFSDNGIKWTFDHLFVTGYTGCQISVGLSISIFFFDTLFWMLLFVILDLVKPGSFGLRKPFALINRFCRRLYFKKHSDEYNANEFRNTLPLRFEQPPQGTKVGIKIRGLRKEFGWFKKTVAVDNVDIDIYEGEIMALLGHNGAGKTTMMSMLTGMFSPTRGLILVDNKNIKTDPLQFRQNLGLCTQHNMCFPKLTVIEHLLFFGMLRGMSHLEAKNCGSEILHLLNLTEKKDCKISKLSGGMLRRLCLGTSLIGKPKVLILDEPTSGLDPENRRQIWDIILKMRGSGTVLITTHFMEEADVLGDRIAIMDHGQVVCCGTTMFLKRIYGTGYTVHIVKESNILLDDIYDKVQKIVPRFQMKIISQTQLDVVIKEDLVEIFPALFEMLEKQRKDLGIKNISVTCTTLEDVFLNVAEKFAEGDYVEGEDKEFLESIKSRMSCVVHEKLTGLSLFFQMIEVTLWKRLIYFHRHFLSFFLAVLFSSILIFLMIWLSDFDSCDLAQEIPLTMDLNVYPGSLNLLKSDQINFKLADTTVQIIQNQRGYVLNVSSDVNITTYAVDLEKKDFTRYIRKTIVALEFINEKFSIFYQPLLNIHSSSIAANLGANILLQNHSKNGSISVVNYPYVLPQDEKCGKTDFFRMASPLYWLFFTSCSLTIFMMSFIPFLSEERNSGFKHQQIIAGLSPLVYWICNFIFDYFLCFFTTVILLLTIMIVGKELDVTVWDSHLISLITQVLFLYSLSGLLFVYLFTFLFDSSVTCSGMFLILNMAIALFPSFLIYLDLIKSYSLFLAMIIILSFNPTFAATISMGHIGKAVVDDELCRICGGIYCKNESSKSLVKIPTNETRTGILIYLVFLAVTSILYLITIALIELDIVRKIIFVFRYKKDTTNRFSHLEDDVKEEAMEMLRAKNSGETNTLRVEGLVKKYVCGPKAVNQVAFLIGRGECFGLLGVNGAGKTTTFKILTGDIFPNSGDAFVVKYSVIKNKRKYLSCIGYCPQFDALLNVLTGEETLNIIAKIRGIPKADLKEEVEFLLSMLGISDHAKKRTVTYSGGTKRRLSTAMAFIGNPEVVFLDEPTTGVDPVSRRQLWGVVQARQGAGQAVVLTSHSMEECEALCSRLTIMRGGQMQCIGTLEHLKAKYGRGYTVLLKLINLIESELIRLKLEFQRVFPESLIKDEHSSLIHYQVLDPNIPLSRLFSQVLKLKNSFDIIEDFIVSNTTLEQLFLAFAQNEEVPKRKTRFSSFHNW